ncbi:MAG: hypothetical protein ABL956_11655, partial [Hyphomonadaceae bacterium]
MRMFRSAAVAALAMSAYAATGPTAAAQTPTTTPPAGATPAANTLAFSRVIDLGQGISMLMGAGGNMAV